MFCQTVLSKEADENTHPNDSISPLTRIFCLRILNEATRQQYGIGATTEGEKHQITLDFVGS